jgi:hypothetical protein
MSDCPRFAALSLIVVLLASCTFLSGPPTQPPVDIVSTELSTPTATVTTPTETVTVESTTPPASPCEIVAESEVTVYERPGSEATVFGSMPPGLRVNVEGRTSDGWLGFEPGIAQAANVGVFRLRWVHESSAIRLEGACDAIPELVGPPAGVCFTMPMDEVHVYAEPDVSSEMIATMLPGDYTAVVSRTTDDWVRVDLSVGNTGLDLKGWIQGTTLNLNGSCEDLPAIEP